jgi:hypothetical protein
VVTDSPQTVPTGLSDRAGNSFASGASPIAGSRAYSKDVVAERTRKTLLWVLLVFGIGAFVIACIAGAYSVAADSSANQAENQFADITVVEGGIAAVLFGILALGCFLGALLFRRPRRPGSTN